MKRATTHLWLTLALCSATAGCFGTAGDGGHAGSGGDGNGTAGEAGSAGHGGAGASGGSAGVGGVVSGAGGAGGFAGSVGAGGGAAGGGMAGAGGVGGVAGSNAGSGGTPASNGSCKTEGQCRLVRDTCCACQPVLGQVHATSLDSMDFGADCSGALCAECPEPTEAIDVVADCVEGLCQAVELSEQAYTECEFDSDCVVTPTDCCGFCGNATLQNSIPLAADSGFDACTEPFGCPDIVCPPPVFQVEAFCTVDRHCSLRNL